MPQAADRAFADRPLPALSAVVARLLALYAEKDYTPEQVAAVLEMDPGLSARVLRLANSAYFGFLGRVDSVQRSVVLLGEVTVQAVSLGTTLLRAWRGTRLPAPVEEVWVHSYVCGLMCRHAARLLPGQVLRAAPDALFLAGLLHDVGKILFLAEAGEGYGTDLEEAATAGELREREIARFGRDHAQAGAELLREWNLPSWLSALVGHHHAGELRAELQAALEVLAASHAVSRGTVPAQGEIVTPGIRAALAERQGRAREEAQEFYRAIS
ncbi:MAG: HDOD domain-containing protein [Thermodesulfobacteriota bacterium]|jgi:putative nucleotidyltransferase with HDIG domain